MKEILVKYTDGWYHEELIQCKDCKFYENSITFDGQGYCLYQNTRGFFRNDDDFCSRAEGKK